jgi:nitrogen fixation NifU-like protein
VSEFYSDKVLEHFKNPRNIGSIPDGPDVGIGTVGNPVCGDIMKIFIKVAERDGVEYVEDVKVQTLGCGAAIATSSMATEMIKGKPLAEAEKLSNQAVTEALGGLPPVKKHCSTLAAQAIKKAIKNYKEKTGNP